MYSSRCEHRNRINGLVDLDFSRHDDPNGPRYSSTVAFAVCEECGDIQMDAKNHRELCEWLRMKKVNA